MKRTIPLLAVASLSFISLGASAAPPIPTANVNVVNTPNVTVTNDVVPVEVTNADSIPVVATVKQPQPYEVYAEFSTSDCSVGCTNLVSGATYVLFDLAPVPSGKRWVITRITGRVPFVSDVAHVALLSMRITSLQFVKEAFFGPYFPAVGSELKGFSTGAFSSYGPGETPHVQVQSAQALSTYGSFLTFSGYLIDAD